MMRRTLQSLVVLSAVLWMIAPQAGDMYKWQDKDGIWHFSDRIPSQGQPFDTFEVSAEPRSMVSMRQSGSEQEPTYHFFNHYHGPAELELRITDAENVKSTPPLPARVVLPARQEVTAVRFEAMDPRASYRYRLMYSWIPGRPLHQLPNDLDFYPPFEAGTEFPISQGIDDRTTHDMPGNHYAVDITMPVGTPVLAVRGGIVMEAEDDFHGEGKQEAHYLNRANHVRILHDDGSMAVYAHLQPNSVRIYPGTRIPVGTWIANSGNTGYSSGPHLHFVIQINAGMALESLPFRFRTRAGVPVTPDRRMMLRGVLSME